MISPQIVAMISMPLVIIGIVVSLPLLAYFETALFFMIGSASWAFLIFRTLRSEASEIYYIGWIWTLVLHLACIVFSIFLPALLGTTLPIPILVTLLALISIVGIFAEIKQMSRK